MVQESLRSDSERFARLVVPCHHGTARPEDADRGEGLRIRRTAANILIIRNDGVWAVADS